MKQKSIKIKVWVQFDPEAEKFFRFPIRNPVRMSLWVNKIQVPSEVNCQSGQIDINNPTSVIISTIWNFGLGQELSIGSQFCLGTYPNCYGKGIVLEIETTE